MHDHVGLTEPGIIAAEPPNPMVNNLVVLPEHRKTPRGVRSKWDMASSSFPVASERAKKCCNLLGLLMDPANAEQKFPLIFTGPASSAVISTASIS